MHENGRTGKTHFQWFCTKTRLDALARKKTTRKWSIDIYIKAKGREIRTVKLTKIRDTLTRRQRQALKNLQRGADIVIKPTDKGSGTVGYEQTRISKRMLHVSRQLNDTQFYRKVTKDKTQYINKRVRFYLSRLLNDIPFQVIPSLAASTYHKLHK